MNNWTWGLLLLAIVGAVAFGIRSRKAANTSPGGSGSHSQTPPTNTQK